MARGLSIWRGAQWCQPSRAVWPHRSPEALCVETWRMLWLVTASQISSIPTRVRSSRGSAFTGVLASNGIAISHGRYRGMAGQRLASRYGVASNTGQCYRLRKCVTSRSALVDPIPDVQPVVRLPAHTTSSRCRPLGKPNYRQLHRHRRPWLFRHGRGKLRLIRRRARQKADRGDRASCATAAGGKLTRPPSKQRPRALRGQVPEG